MFDGKSSFLLQVVFFEISRRRSFAFAVAALFFLLFPVLPADKLQSVWLLTISFNCCSSSAQQLETAGSRDDAQVTTAGSSAGARWDDDDDDDFFCQLLQGVLVFHYVTISRHLYSFGLPCWTLKLIRKGPPPVDPTSNHLTLDLWKIILLAVRVAFRFLTHVQVPTYTCRQFSQEKGGRSSVLEESNDKRYFDSPPNRQIRVLSISGAVFSGLELCLRAAFFTALR